MSKADMFCGANMQDARTSLVDEVSNDAPGVLRFRLNVVGPKGHGIPDVKSSISNHGVSI